MCFIRVLYIQIINQLVTVPRGFVYVFLKVFNKLVLKSLRFLAYKLKFYSQVKTKVLNLVNNTVTVAVVLKIRSSFTCLVLQQMLLLSKVTTFPVGEDVKP